ncbi:hypothetical protein CTA2_827, partial [Colletotrichum tanaceti]
MGLGYEPRDSRGLLNVIPKRYDSEGKQISTHVFPSTVLRLLIKSPESVLWLSWRDALQQQQQQQP